ncbi:MAG: glycosyl transferase family protein [Acidobacteriaceae bacterium]|nr:glycosyl transferase family protein [Acidobacteriaceae bacterium]
MRTGLLPHFADISPGQLALAFLSCLLLFSGLDDFVPVLVCLWHGFLRPKPEPSSDGEGEALTERRIAIFVPCWKESGVIERMIRQNLARIRYDSFDFFLGVYPNDQATVEVAEDLSRNLSNVHVAVCPHPGPTSKADCLNSVYDGMCRYEAQTGVQFDTVVLHDAEDVIHADALRVIHRERFRYAMVQVPVLPLPTPFTEFTHAVYCDEFAEFQSIDMRAREYCSSFIPSNGVGTGFARKILDQLARDRNGRVFDPASLTEDYEIGLYIYAAGFPQRFSPLTRDSKNQLVATREYFPMNIRFAIRQRTRWVTGITLQCWEHVGWQGSGWTKYWFWRDRKGLITNPLSLLTNLVFVAGVVDWIRSAAAHRPWAFAITHPRIIALCWATLVLQCFRLCLRIICVAGLFGSPFAAGVPLRAFHANFINTCATLRAVWRYTRARLRKTAHVWLKTDHAYPTSESGHLERRPLADVLAQSGFVTQPELQTALTHVTGDNDLADHLLARGLMSETELCRALSLQCGAPIAKIDLRRLHRSATRTLPASIENRFKVVPFKIERGKLYLAGSRAPVGDTWTALSKFTSLATEFQLVPSTTYNRLRALLYGS